MPDESPSDGIRKADRKCPKCGSNVFQNSRHAWCVGSREPRPDQKTCLYGIDTLVTLQQHREAP